MSAEDIVIDSANAAANTVATNEFVKLTQNALKLTGAELGRHVKPTDGPGLFSPVDVAEDGKDRLGAVLALEDRAIIGWIVGTFRIKNFESVIPYDSIESVERGTRAGSALSKERETLRVKADGKTWELVFANIFEGGRSIVPFIEGMLEGTITPVFETE